MRIILIISRIIAGTLFIFSGTVKAIDPLGSEYKFHDYFQAFGLDFLQPLSLPLAVILFTAEFITGFCVLTGIRAKEGALGMFILILFFTPLTFILALTNPVSDCGCFGDAVHLTNWETFWKNIALLIFILIIFLNRKGIHSGFRPAAEWTAASAATVLLIGFSLCNLRYLPVIDFLPYTTGTVIKEKMTIPAGAPVDKYETTFIYEKDGQKKEFTLENYPASDTSWKFIDQRSLLVSKGFVAEIHDFSITAMDKTDLTDSILTNTGYTLLMVSIKLEKAGKEKLRKGFETGMKCRTEGIDFYILTASGTDMVTGYQNGLRFCQTDETTLKTMIRSNPGYILLRNGTIVGKWSWANLPEDLAQFKNNTNN
jgi:uncharacterized membrane protein YphA (DoxX/SURF4 family)